MTDSDRVLSPRIEPVSLWRREPFRIFFPLAVVLGWIGVGHWLTYATGVTATYSCETHGLIQMQAFVVAFAMGFLLTAVPNRTRSPAVTSIESSAMIAALIATTAAAQAERWVLSEIAYAAALLLLAQFALRRFVGRTAGRRPPAAFVLVPVAAMQGLGGAALIAAAQFDNVAGWAAGLGRLMVEQGVFLCLAVGVGALILPLIGAAPPPRDLGSSPREAWKALAYGTAGVAIFASFLLEQAGFEHGGPLLRAMVVAIGLALGGGVWRAPGKTGVHRRLVWLAAWLIPAGLVVSGLWPDYRVPALHILFIGGFSLLAFGVATHVSLGHLNLERHASGRPLAVVMLGVAFMVAMLIRFTADSSETYFSHLGWAAAIWIFGSAAWLVFLGPRLLRSGSAAPSRN